MRLSFVKMEAAGNDYIYFDGVSKRLPRIDWSILSSILADRHRGVGSDGLILILPSEEADFEMRIFNADGSEGDMCGNGVRCLGLYAWDHGLASGSTFTVSTRAGEVTLEVSECDDVCSVDVTMPPPGFLRGEVPMAGNPRLLGAGVSLRLEGHTIPVYGVRVGNPNCVIFVRDPYAVDLETLGPLLEEHALFPMKTNVELVTVVDRHHIQARVWERGSGITLSCGTGACAAAIWAIRRGLCESPVEVTMPGGRLSVRWDGAEDLHLTGPVRESFRGSVIVPRATLLSPDDKCEENTE